MPGDAGAEKKKKAVKKKPKVKPKNQAKRGYAKLKKPAHADKILDAIEALWGFETRDMPHLKHDEPLDGLILTVLSQHTNDKNRDMAFAQLKATYPTWEEAAAAAKDEIADAIKSAGLGNTKAQKIKGILPEIYARFGEYSIKELADWKTEEARDFLESLPGVGPKTAACVLVFDLDMYAFPVDTHIARISRRLGWVAEKTPADKIQEYLEATLPKERFHGAHLNMIEHGRGVCSARSPKCKECPLNKWCKFAKSLDV